MRARVGKFHQPEDAGSNLDGGGKIVSINKIEIMTNELGLITGAKKNDPGHGRTVPKDARGH